MNERNEKDPFAEYDKFWDELNEIDEIKEDQDFFKKKDYRFNRINQEQYQKFGKIFVIGFISLFVFVFVLMIVQTARFFPMMGFTPIISVFSFIIFIIIIFKIFGRQK
jgi:fatty-acid desaturase